MRFTVNANEFKVALEKAFKATGIKTIETLENVLVRKIGHDVHLMATNMNQFVDIKIDSDTKDDIEFQFSDTKTLLKAMKFFTGYHIEFDCSEHEVTISCGGKKAKQNIINADFPKFPIVDGEIHNEFKYVKKKLKERFEAIKYAASADEQKGILTGICFRNNDMTAIDGYRIAINKDENLNVARSFVVSVAALKNVTEIMNDKIEIVTNGKFMKVMDDKAVFITKLLSGDYMDYSKHFTQSYDKSILINIKDFNSGLKYLKTFKELKNKDGVHWCGNKIGIKNTNGYFESKIDIEGKMDLEIAFNGDFMLDALGQFERKVKITLGTNVSPMIITAENDINNIALILPVISTERLFESVA